MKYPPKEREREREKQPRQAKMIEGNSIEPRLWILIESEWIDPKSLFARSTDSITTYTYSQFAYDLLLSFKWITVNSLNMQKTTIPK